MGIFGKTDATSARQRSPVTAPSATTSRCVLRLLTAVTICVISAQPSQSAEVRDFGGELVLEGKIAVGDYEKVRDLIDGLQAQSIYLASPGGNLAEAIKIGRLVRKLKFRTVIPTRGVLGQSFAARDMKDFRTNYLCASACFFVFVAGVQRDTDFSGDDPLLGIHRPFLSESDLNMLSANQAMASASQLQALVESYLKEMSVPAKYADLMFSIPKDDIRWISRTDFEKDLEGIIPELRDWVDARCDTRTESEKIDWNNLKNKSTVEESPVERIVSEQLVKKMLEIDQCNSKSISNLSHDAYLVMFPQVRDDLARYVREHPLEDAPLEDAKTPWWQFWK